MRVIAHLHITKAQLVAMVKIIGCFILLILFSLRYRGDDVPHCYYLKPRSMPTTVVYELLYLLQMIVLYLLKYLSH